MAPPKHFSLSIEQLHAEAIAATGLKDFGDDSYRPALQVLLDSYDASAELGDLGRYSVWAMLLNCLRGRLLAQQGIKENKDNLQAEISKPLFIVGLPRTGTTILHRLLAADPRNQALEYWLSSFPQPRPPRAEWEQNPRYQEVEHSLQMLDQIAPEMKQIHEMTAAGADECRMLLMQSFVNVTFQANAGVADYEQWLYHADLGPAYALYRDCLRLIGCNDPDRRWVLKDPSHLWAMDTLLETFPDATIIQTHRNPVQLIPSVSSLVLTARRMQEPSVEAAVVGAGELAQWSRVLNKTLQVRRSQPDRFIDVYYEDFVRDPIAVVTDLYAQTATEFEPEIEARMRQWMNDQPANKHGGHSYSAEEFGLTEHGIRTEFEDYCEFFGV
jgi:hypothetical protein